LSATLPASRSISADDLMMPSPSRSHCTTAPPMKTLPSSAYSRVPRGAARYRRQQFVARRDGLAARVHEHEAAGAVGILDHPGTAAPLAE
jgi:hypothetical protein